ncbi:MAG: hypothetical protein WC637_06600 [Victivallales bacterium]|jgi:rRNA maturation protein Nop10
MDDENKNRRYTASKKPSACPNCGKKTVVPIAYGYPTQETFHKIRQGKLLSGGCCVSGDDPEWGCTDCGIEIYNE